MEKDNARYHLAAYRIKRLAEKPPFGGLLDQETLRGVGADIFYLTRSAPHNPHVSLVYILDGWLAAQAEWEKETVQI